MREIHTIRANVGPFCLAGPVGPCLAELPKHPNTEPPKNCLFALLAVLLVGCAHHSPMNRTTPSPQQIVLDYSTPCDPTLQAALVKLDTTLRAKYGIATNQTAVGILDLASPRLAMLNPDLEMYGASVPKIAILLAYFELHRAAATNLDAQTHHELGLMIKRSSNELAAKYSRQIGLAEIRRVLDRYQFYDQARGGGIWVGKHYGESGERVGDPVGDHSHAATVRQLLRYCLLLEQGKLVSPEASRAMREIFASPNIPHERNKFVKGLEGRDLQVLRKSGSWENWLHDLAIVSGPGRHYIIVALTEHPEGDAYLAELAPTVDDLLLRRETGL